MRRARLSRSSVRRVWLSDRLAFPRCAARISVEIVRAFVHLRRFALTNRDLARKIADLESRYEGQFDQIFNALRALLASPEPSHNRKMGFQQSRE